MHSSASVKTIFVVAQSMLKRKSRNILMIVTHPDANGCICTQDPSQVMILTVNQGQTANMHRSFICFKFKRNRRAWGATVRDSLHRDVNCTSCCLDCVFLSVVLMPCLLPLSSLVGAFLAVSSVSVRKIARSAHTTTEIG